MKSTLKEHSDVCESLDSKRLRGKNERKRGFSSSIGQNQAVKDKADFSEFSLLKAHCRGCDWLVVMLKSKTKLWPSSPSLYALGSCFVSRIKGIRSSSS